MIIAMILGITFTMLFAFFIVADQLYDFDHILVATAILLLAAFSLLASLLINN
jgi:hypothetical protein